MTNNQLKKLRKAKGWSQERLASAIGVSVDLVRKMEQGKTPVSDKTITKLVKITNICTFTQNKS